MNTQENELLRNAVLNLDWEFGGIESRIETLSDIDTRLSWLVDDMYEDKFADIGAVIHMFKEHHQTIRILQKLLSYTMDDLNEYYRKANEFKEILFDGLVRKEKAAAGKVGE